MFSRPQIPAIISALCVTLLAAGCSSSGTVGASSAANNATGSFTSGDAGGSTGTDTSTDAGCAEAEQAILTAEKAQSAGPSPAALAAANSSIAHLRDAALTTEKPGAKDAMNKAADDIQSVVDQMENGQQPSIQHALDDARAVLTICRA